MELREELEMEFCFLVVRLYAKLSYIHYAPAADFFVIKRFVLLWWPDLMLVYVQRHSSAACHC